jgi:hypothetical protein
MASPRVVGVRHQAVGFDHVERGQRGDAGQRIAAEGGTVVARLEHAGGAPAARQAPIGTPEPSPLARVMTSGRMPACWWANHTPVRPMPHCTSSTMNSQFFGRRSAQRTHVILVRDVDAALALDRLEQHGDDVRIARGELLDGREVVEGHPHEAATSGSKPACTLRLPVADSVARVRPWKACSMTTIAGCSMPCWWPYMRASLMAASLASQPELQKNTSSMRDSAARRSDAASASGCGKGSTYA